MHTGTVVLLKEEARHLVSDGRETGLQAGSREPTGIRGLAAMRSLRFELSG
jgi:hypothetical protein